MGRFRWLIMSSIANFVSSQLLSTCSNYMLVAAITVATCAASPEVPVQDKTLENISFSWALSQRMGNFAAIDLESNDHKLLFPLDAYDWIGIFATVIGVMMASGGGIGGGGILVPVYVLIMNFDPKLAVPLSNATILGGAAANMILNYRKRHPTNDNPLVNWDLILIMEPPTIGGAIIGSILSKMLPNEVIVTFLVILLSLISYRSLVTGVRLYERESRVLRKEQEMLNESDLLMDKDFYANRDADGGSNEAAYTFQDFEKSAYPIDSTNIFGTIEEKYHPDEAYFESEELKDILEQERHTPIIKVLCLTGFFFITLGLSFYQRTLTCGSTAYMLMFVATFACVILFSSASRYQLVKEWRKKQMLGYPFIEGDVEWTPRNAILYPSLCTFAGVFAGLLGIGGGIIQGPLMLKLGVIPQVASATSACMILYTSFTATSSFLAFGLLREDYAIVSVIVGFLATAIGQIIISHLVQKYRRSSLIVLSIGSVVALSTVLLGWESIITLLTSTDSESTSFCNFDTA